MTRWRISLLWPLWAFAVTFKPRRTCWNWEPKFSFRDVLDLWNLMWSSQVYVFLLILFKSVWLCNKYSSPKIDSVLLNEWHFHCLKTSGIRLKISFEERLKDCKTFWTESSEAGSLKFLCQSQLSQSSITTFSQIVKRSSLGLWWSTDWVMTDLKFLKNWPQGPMLWFLVGIFLPKIFAFSTLNTAYLCKKCWYHNTDFKVKRRNYWSKHWPLEETANMTVLPRGERDSRITRFWRCNIPKWGKIPTQRTTNVTNDYIIYKMALR
jgi:hypothetical protein